MLTNTHTYYSYKFGTWKPESLLKQAIEFGYDTICITDINSTSAVIECIRLAKNEIPIRVIPGIDFRNGADQKFMAIPKNNKGYRAINEYLTRHLHKEDPIPDLAPNWEDVWVIYPFDNLSVVSYQLSAAVNGSLTADDLPLKINHFIGIRPQDIPQLRLSPLRHQLDKLVMLPTVTFENQRDFNTHRLLRSIDKNLLLSKLPKAEEGDARHLLMPKKKLLGFYVGFPEIVRNTEAMLEPCEMDSSFSLIKTSRCFPVLVKMILNCSAAKLKRGCVIDLISQIRRF